VTTKVHHEFRASAEESHQLDTAFFPACQTSWSRCDQILDFPAVAEKGEKRIHK